MQQESRPMSHRRIDSGPKFDSVCACVCVCVCVCVRVYDGNSRSKVPYFIPAERISALSWQAWVSVSTVIHHQTSVVVTTSGDVNRHSGSFKMATILKE
jgi:hypothetical protein